MEVLFFERSDFQFLLDSSLLITSFGVCYDSIVRLHFPLLIPIVQIGSCCFLALTAVAAWLRVTLSNLKFRSSNDCSNVRSKDSGNPKVLECQELNTIRPDGRQRDLSDERGGLNPLDSFDKKSPKIERVLPNVTFVMYQNNFRFQIANVIPRHRTDPSASSKETPLNKILMLNLKQNWACFRPAFHSHYFNKSMDSVSNGHCL